MRCSLRLAAVLFIQFISPCLAGQQAYIPEKFKGIILFAPQPDFPPQRMSQNTMGGWGCYRMSINQTTGTVDEVRVLRRSGHRPLDAAAVMEFFQWKFKPGTIKLLDVPVDFYRYVDVDLRRACSK